MVKKVSTLLLSILLVFLIPINAYAATTSSFMKFNAPKLMSLDDDYGISLLSATSSFSFAMSPCFYNYSTDSFTGITWSPISFPLTSRISKRSDFSLNGVIDSSVCTGYAFQFSNLNITGSNVDILLTPLIVQPGLIVGSSSDLYPNLTPFASPSRCWARVYFSGSEHVNNSWLPLSTNEVRDASIYFVANDANYNSGLDAHLSCDISLPSRYATGHVEKIEMFFGFGFSDSNFDRFSSSLPRVQGSLVQIRNYLYADGSSNYPFNVYLNYSDVSSSSSASAGFGAISQSISTLSTNITNQINQVKQDIQTGSNQVSQSITQQTQEIGSKIDSFKQSVVDKFNETKQAIVDVKESILDLPNKIKEMLISLIVPTQEDLLDSFDSFSQLAESKLGIIWQVPEMFITFLSDFISALQNKTGTFLFPAFKLNFLGTQYLLWDDYTVNLEPEGFEELFTFVRLLTSFVLLTNFVNGLIILKEEFVERRNS